MSSTSRSMASNPAKLDLTDRVWQLETRSSDSLYVSDCFAKPAFTIISHPCEAAATALLSPLPEILYVDLEDDSKSSSSYPPRIDSKKRIPTQSGTAPSMFSCRVSTVKQGRMSVTLS